MPVTDAKSAYLAAYNLACMFGWFYALLLAGQSLLTTGGDLAQVWGAMGLSIHAAQWAMSLEMVHAKLKFVSSPFFTTCLQVTSRLLLMVVIMGAPSVSATWHCGMMAISWSLVEVARYAFYLNGLLGPGGQTGVLFPIFWLRYSLFAILYPTGITGEVLTMVAALSDAAFGTALGGYAPLLVKASLAAYAPGSPFMYMNMVGNRKKAFKKRFAPPPPPPKAPVGVEFPEDGLGQGGRSTSEAGKKVFAAAFAGMGTKEGDAASAKCAAVKNWRFGYNKQIVSLVRLGCTSPKAALGSAEAGLKWMYENMVFHSADQSLKGPFGSTVDQVKDKFHTGTVSGTKSKKDLAYKVPYDGGWHPTKPHPPPADKVLSGDALKAQATTWAETGIIEPDAAQALCFTADHFASGKTLENVYVVMVGAGSAMGPFPKLLEMGATVVAVDIPGGWGKGGKRPTSTLWKRLCETAKASPGALIFPLAKPQEEFKGDEQAMYEASGCDLMKQPGEIANWLVEWQKTLPPSAKVMIGNYTYLDGDLHVKLALCADYVIQALRKARPSTGVAFLCTPTDIHVCTDASDAAARANYGSGLGSLGLEKLMNVLSGGKFLIKNFQSPVKAEGGKSLKLVDGLSVAQGPNYALAKRMQHWRAQIEYDKGATVSSMVAPSTATLSVIHNKTFAWAYGGMPYFKYEIFKQETTNAVMAAMLMHDILNEAGPKNAKNRAKYGVDNTLQLFQSQAVHGGLWRSPYKVDSLGETSALIYFGGLAAPYLAALVAAGGAAAFYFA